MGTTASFHPDYVNAPVGGLRQQLCTRTPFANDDLSARIEANQVKHGLAQVNTDRV
jgi:hypothetical protein